MRSGSKRFLIGVGTFIMAAAMTAPSFAAKKAVSDEELDMVTAAGQPVVINVSGAGTVTFTAFTSLTASSPQPSSQQNLRALVLNNVLGENQQHDGINLATATDGATVGNQLNFITQSWGAVSDIRGVTTDSVSNSAVVNCNAAALICKGSATVAVGQGAVTVLTRAGDQIISVGYNPDGTKLTSSVSLVTYNPTTNIAQDVGESSQTNLVALTVNNVVGLNQTGNGVNVIGGGSGVTVGTNLAVSVGNLSGSSQGNTIAAYRGAPSNFSR